jgi:hypothetical protein
MLILPLGREAVSRRWVSLAVAMMVGAWGGPPRRAAAEVLAVPDAFRQLHAPREEHHVLRAPDGALLGEQHYRVAVAGDRLTFDSQTRFVRGDESDEHGELDLADGFRSRRFDKTVRLEGRPIQEQHVDFATGAVRWLVDGVRAERAMQFPPDTYIGSMLALVLSAVPEKHPAASSFQALVFRPDPMVVTLKAEAVDEEQFPCGTRVPVATKLRVKADLGPVKNVLFASLIPTHYFWFTHSSEPEFVAFEGKLWNGLDVVMTPEAPVTTTAHAP